jgi:hypothetical protein
VIEVIPIVTVVNVGFVTLKVSELIELTVSVPSMITLPRTSKNSLGTVDPIPTSPLVFITKLSSST